MDQEVEILLEALNCYEITILETTNKNVKLENGYEIEIEMNGLYKLTDNGYVIAPFNDLNDLCRFIKLC